MSEVKKDDNTCIVDASGEELAKQRIMQTKTAVRRQAMVELVMRQTDYTEEFSSRKLEEWNNNYLNVIKEYMNPNFQQRKEVKPVKTTKNQMIYGEIRNFMDGVNREQINRKLKTEQLEQRKVAYIAYMEKLKHAEKADSVN